MERGFVGKRTETQPRVVRIENLNGVVREESKKGLSVKVEYIMPESKLMGWDNKYKGHLVGALKDAKQSLVKDEDRGIVQITLQKNAFVPNRKVTNIDQVLYAEMTR